MLSHKCKCLKCGYEWISTVNRAKRCPNGECQTVNWDVEPEEKYIPLPIFNHKERKPLKCLNGRCPYCSGTTGSKSGVLFCYSCDQTWNMITREPQGIVDRIGEP